MIGYICGKIETIGDKYVIIDVHGVGYRVHIPQKSRDSISEIGSEIKLYTHFSMNPRDGAVELYGFERPQELRFFELLTSISGIGPKSAQAILAAAELEQLQAGIIKGDDGYLTKVAGIGSKTAQRLILELKSKILLTADLSGNAGGSLNSESEALDALMVLGYSQQQSREVLKLVGQEAETAEDKIKEALRLLNRNNQSK